MLFEVQDLSQASPATVSRCGMVYIDSNELRWMPYVQTWANKRLDNDVINEEMFHFLIDTFVTYVDDGLEFVRNNCKEGIHQVYKFFIAVLYSFYYQNIIIFKYFFLL